MGTASSTAPCCRPAGLRTAPACCSVCQSATSLALAVAAAASARPPAICALENVGGGAARVCDAALHGDGVACEAGTEGRHVQPSSTVQANN